ncbi:MAG: L-threonylcarbamoyladenylate synthase, partial [Caldilineaceae bacterium]
AQALLKASGLPIAAPSANLFGHTSPTSADHVLADLDGRIDLVLDSGETPIGVESTVLDVTGMDEGRPAVILRPGGVTIEGLLHVLGPGTVRDPGSIIPLTESGAPLASPGLLDRHYAPQTPLHLFVSGPGEPRRVTLDALQEAVMGEILAGGLPVLLCYTEDWPRFEGIDELGCPIVFLGPAHDVEGVARVLYRALRKADEQAIAAKGTVLLARELPGGGLAAAVRDRMRRAAARIIVCPA